jgi:hypothetical protein
VIPRRADTVSMLMTSFDLPGGNGLPTLEITAFEPLSFIQEEAAKRDSTLIEKGKERLKEAGGKLDGLGNVLTEGVTASVLDGVKESVKGVAILAVLLILGAALVVLGAYQFTKD